MENGYFMGIPHFQTHPYGRLGCSVLNVPWASSKWSQSPFPLPALWFSKVGLLGPKICITSNIGIIIIPLSIILDISNILIIITYITISQQTFGLVHCHALPRSRLISRLRFCIPRFFGHFAKIWPNKYPNQPWCSAGMHWMYSFLLYPLVNVYITMENHHL